MASQTGQFQLNQILPACSGLAALGTFTIAFTSIIIVPFKGPSPSFLAFTAVTVTAFTAQSFIVDHPCLVLQPSILTVAFAVRPFLAACQRVLPFIAHQLAQLVLAIVGVPHHRRRQQDRGLRWLHRLMEVLDLLGRQSYLEFYLL